MAPQNTPGAIPVRLVGPGTRDAGPPAFARIAIVGLNAAGASLGLALRQAWPSSLVIGVDASDVLETAIRLAVVDVGADDHFIIGDADLIVLAGDLAGLGGWLPALPDLVVGDATVLSLVDSVRLADHASAWPSRLVCVEGRVDAAPVAPGLDGARADLFVGRRWAVHPVPGGATNVPMARVIAFVRAVGADPDVQPAPAN